jgi:hypothetical protein
MRILFDNLIYNSILSATNVNDNYPLSNLKSDHLKKIYKATENSVVITILFPEISTINCAYYGYTNAASFVISLYNSSDVLLLSATAPNVSRGGGNITRTEGVSYAKITLVSSDTIYMGSIGMGLAYTMPLMDNNVVLKPIDNSEREYSADGQIYINRVNILHKLDVTYSFENIDTYNEILALWEDLQHPAWVDPYEQNTGMINPMFCDITMDDKPSQSWGWYKWGHSYREVR